MANWYIDFANGDDGDAGTELSPKKTMQAAVNVATGGDTFFLGDNAAHVLTASITWNTGFTADNTKYTKFKPYSVDGTYTIQRPDEATARVGAVININGTGATLFNATSRPEKIVFENLEIRNSGASNGYFNGGANYIFEGCYFDTTGLTADGILATTELTFKNNYIIVNYATSVNFLRASTGSFANALISENYFKFISLGNGIEGANNSGGQISYNIFDGAGCTSSVATRAFVRLSNSSMSVIGNTFIGTTVSAAAIYGVRADFSRSNLSLYNNVFYNFKNSGVQAMFYGSNEYFSLIGNNAFFDCDVLTTSPNTDRIALNLTANDITASVNPFVNAAANNYQLIEAYRNTALANPNSSLDIGAVQSTGSGGGGGSSEFSFANIV